MNGFTGPENYLVALFDGAGVFWLALVVALGVGALHAVAPGHGKSVTAAYLIGIHGRYRDAVRLGVVVALMHTVSVLALALAWVGLTSAAVGTQAVTAWLQVIAGAVVIAVGAHLTYRHLRLHKPHGHGDSHGHGHGHGHSRDQPADPWSRRGLTALALSGGLVPSPSAFIVLVSGLLTGRAVDAVVLVLAFGLGMAVTLTAVGVVTVRGAALLSRRTPGLRLVRAAVAWTPALAGVAVTIGGCLYLATAVTALSA
ncbi:sulfite exporter TauE/SafE family protein [Nonomuraea sp. B12E4]|uniref:nickel/cobalt transporter n=1 Tax=Nonomuraea sp. B12E4 TaxID=3153564 RepID=UPI00325F08D4